MSQLLLRIGLALDRSILGADLALGRFIRVIRERLPDSEYFDRTPRLPIGDAEIPTGSVADFVRQCIEKHSGNALRAVDIFESYCDWADANGFEPAPLPSFCRALEALGLQSCCVEARGRWFFGVEFRMKTTALRIDAV